jgi:DNA-directed RNA polymerase specialized sigma subunit
MPTTQRETRWDLAELHAEYLAALERLGIASQQLRDALTDSHASLLVVREQAEAQGRISDLVAMIDPKPLRVSLASALTELERARHASQKVLFRILFVEGTSMSDIARHWGISRQLVSRLINEPT